MAPEKGEKGEFGNEQTPEEKAKLKAEEESKLKLQESEKEKLGKGGEEKPKVDEKTDYKVLFEDEKKKREVAEEAHRQVQSGLTPKLQELADLKKAETERQIKVQAAEDDDLVKIDTQLTKTEDEIAKCKAEKIDTTHLETGKAALLFQRKQVVRDRAVRFEQKKWLDFKDANPEFTDYATLDKIVNEAAKRGDALSPGSAYVIWQKDQEIAKAKESAEIDKDSEKLSDKAKGEDGKIVPEPQGKSGATWEFYKQNYGEKKAAEMLGIKE